MEKVNPIDELARLSEWLRRAKEQLDEADAAVEVARNVLEKALARQKEVAEVVERYRARVKAIAPSVI